MADENIACIYGSSLAVYSIQIRRLSRSGYGIVGVTTFNQPQHATYRGGIRSGLCLTRREIEPRPIHCERRKPHE